MPRFAANISMMFNEVPFLERFALARNAGFTAVEFTFGYDHRAQRLVELVEYHDLTVALFNMPKGEGVNDRGVAAVAGREDEFRDQVEVALEYARALRPLNVHVMSGNAAADDAEARAIYVANLRYAAQRFGDSNTGLVIEPLNSRDIPGYYLSDFDFARDVIAEVDAPNLGLQFDIYHRQVQRGDVMGGLREMLPIIRHVQISATPGRHEPGSGELDDFEVLRRLDSMGYDGFVGCEYRPASSTIEGLGWMSDFQRRVAAVEGRA